MNEAPITYARAKAMRRAPTEAERRLWGALRNRSLSNFKFVRQQPVGPYIVDFLCRAQKLIVEVDGATHGNEDQIEHDKGRAAFLVGLGYHIIRVDNHDVFSNLAGVLDLIVAQLNKRQEGTSSVTS